MSFVKNIKTGVWKVYNFNLFDIDKIYWGTMIMTDFSDTESETSSSDKEESTPQVKETYVQQVSMKLPFADQVKQFVKEN